ncbi:JmjC-domain-containing protein [Neoconidiobolus thromboides FSU 785]|nr:JmjC-domain-containing protein [Neoconidiobolus thromboides FSU 785]
MEDLEQVIDLPYLSIPDKKQRCFDLKNAPTYFPTELEFKDPTKYIASIKQEAEQFGICKIIPPKSFQPSFSLDLKNFKFNSRSQQLNSISAKNHERLNFINNIKQFHYQYGKVMDHELTLFHKPIDLYFLSQQVKFLGGRNKICEKKLYGQLARNLGYDVKVHPSISSAVKAFYDTWLYPYDQYINTKMGNNNNNTNNNSKKRVKLSENRKEEKENSCVLCTCNSKLNEIIQCTECNLNCHFTCLIPQMNKKPEGEFYCSTCIKLREIDIGFEEGDSYTLEQFKLRADTFKRKYFEDLYKNNKINKPFDQFTLQERESIAEIEFWNLVNNPISQIEVEYGADLPASYFGSGFPTKEKEPHDKLSENPWNLNILPTLPTSMFSHLNTSISGMTVPWLYVGMCFSTFCWHNEDHYAYSLNYQHWGDTKTWYGIPGLAANQFEMAMKKEVPNLFERHPNVLSHLALTISPDVLLRHQVPVYSVDQRPGEFVVTFPKAYHAGFNQGLNFNEAVNFAPLDWSKFGFECIERYSKFKIAPIFSHEQLIIKTAQKPSNLQQAKDLIEMLKELMNKEIQLRKKIKRIIILEKEESYPLNQEIVVKNCAFCNVPCYLSYIQCTCDKKEIISCSEHMSCICNCRLLERQLIIKVTIEQIQQIIYQLKNYPIKESEWKLKYQQIMMKNYLPPLTEIEILIEEIPINGNYSEEIEYLKLCLNECYIFRELAKAILKPKACSPRSLLVPNKNQNQLSYLKELIVKSKQLKFDFVEIQLVLNLNKEIEKIELEVKEIQKMMENNIKVDKEQLKMLKQKLDQIPFFIQEKTIIENLSLKFNNEF